MKSGPIGVAIATAALGMLTGCATIIRGPDDQLTIQSTPKGAAVKTSNGMSCTATPCVLTMPRRSDIVVTLSKPGCQTAEVKVTHKPHGPVGLHVAVTVITGNFVGLAVNEASGAWLDLTPNPVKVTLKCP